MTFIDDVPAPDFKRAESAPPVTLELGMLNRLIFVFMFDMFVCLDVVLLLVLILLLAVSFLVAYRSCSYCW